MRFGWTTGLTLTVLVGGAVALTGPTRMDWGGCKSNPQLAQIHMNNLSMAIDSYRRHTRKLPQTLEDLTQTNDRNPEPYIKSIPKDPWGNTYEYRTNGNKDFTIRSNGDDGQPDTGDDIVWPKKEE